MIADVLEGRARWCVLEGKWQDVLPSDLRVDHVITDPQYEEEAHTKQRRSLKDATQKRGAVNTGEIRRVESVLPFPAMTPEERDAFGVMAARSCRRWVVAFCQIEGVDRWKKSLTAASLDWIRGGVWIKPDGMPQFTGDRPGQGFESLAISHPKGRKRWNGGGKHAIWTCSLSHGHGNGQRNEHPTQKPLRLMIQLVEDFTDPGDVILDPYCGSGTTGVACLRLGRRFIGCEMSPVHAATSRDRLTAESQDSTLDAYRRGQVPLFG